MTDSPPQLELWRIELRRLRLKSRLTNEALAQLVSEHPLTKYPVSAQQVSNWQNGRGGKVPSFEHQRALAELVFRDDPEVIWGSVDSNEGDPRGDDPGSY